MQSGLWLLNVVGSQEATFRFPGSEAKSSMLSMLLSLFGAYEAKIEETKDAPY